MPRVPINQSYEQKINKKSLTNQYIYIYIYSNLVFINIKAKTFTDSSILLMVTEMNKLVEVAKH